MKKHFLAFALAGMLLTPLHAQDTLYHDLGDKDGIAKIANLATDNFLADKRISATFDQTDMAHFRAMLSEQFCTVAGGPCIYTGHDMATAHKGLHLTNADFNAVVEDLQAAMETLGIPFPVQNELLARLAPMQHQIVTK